MDQSNFYTDNQNQMQPPRVRKNAAYFRARAREILKPVYWMAVLATLIATLLGAVVGGFSALGSLDIEIGNGKIEIGDEVSLDVMGVIRLLDDRDFGALFEAYPIIPLVVGVVAGSALVSLLVSIFVGAPLTLGYRRYLLDLNDGKDGQSLSVLFDYFKKSYAKSVGLRIVYALIQGLASLPLTVTVLILCWINRRALITAVNLTEGQAFSTATAFAILGMVAVILVVAILTLVLVIWLNYRYLYCYTIMAEYPEIGVLEALRYSANLMRGNKWRLFCLQFSFIGWVFLAALVPAGLGMFFLNPYYCTAVTAFYDEIANRSAARETEFPSLNPDDYIMD